MISRWRRRCRRRPILVIVKMNVARIRVRLIRIVGMCQRVPGAIEWLTIAMVTDAKGDHNVGRLIVPSDESKPAVRCPRLKGLFHFGAHLFLANFR